MAWFERRAEWIWRQRGIGKLAFVSGPPPFAAESNRFIYFRRTFELAAPTSHATVVASADGRYQLFANGHLVGRGPARCSPALQPVDAYDLAPYLRVGRNVIAALVHSYGRVTAWYELPGWEQARVFGCGGFYLQGDVVTAAGSTPVNTDETWRYRQAAACQRDTPGCSLGFVEVFDARREPPRWTQPSFDDAGWDAAEVLRVPGRNYAGDIVPFPALTPRAIPPLWEEWRCAQAITLLGEVDNAPEVGDVAAQMAQEAVSPLTRCQAHGVENLVADAGSAEITTTAEQSVSFVLDFGGIVTGRVRLELDGPAGTIVDFAYGDRLQPDGRVHPVEGIPGYDGVRQAHRYITREGSQTWEQFEWAGFRYLQVTFRNCARPLRVRRIGVNATGYPVGVRGRFACSDPQLDRIWQAGADTLRLCMHDAYEDCPTREQRQWVGDAYVEMLVNYAAFGDALLAARLLRQAAGSQQPDGMTMMAASCDFGVTNSFNIPDFCLYWILGIERYVTYTGDTALAAELYPAVARAIGWFERHLDADGLLRDVPHWVFIDWAELDKQGQVTALNAQFVAALHAAAALAHQAGWPSMATRHQALAAQVTSAINAHLWDEARGVYADARNHGVLSRRISQQANAMAIACDVAPRERWARILTTILDGKRLVLTRTGDGDTAAPLFDEEHHVVLAQPFVMHHLHRALSKAGLHAVLVENIRVRWGALLAEGQTTLRETWQLAEITSLCHAWSATPTFDLATEVLGVTPLAPGFSRCRVAPHPAELAWAEGTFPSPQGDITVAWRHSAGCFELSVIVPEACEVAVVLPEECGPWPHVTVDGSRVAELPVLGPGVHRITARSG